MVAHLEGGGLMLVRGGCCNPLQAQFDVLQRPTLDGKGCWILRDKGPWTVHPTITNDVEWVVHALANLGLKDGQQVFYFDSEGMLDEILHEGGRFKGFRAGPSIRPAP